MESVACVFCGAPLALAEAEVTEEGPRCRPCSLRHEVVGHVAAVAAADEARRDAALRDRTGRVAWGHLVVWLGCVVIFCAAGAGGHERWFWPLAALVAVPIVGLLLRQAWAWRVLVGVDAVALAALLAWTPFVDGDGRLALLFIAAIPALLLVGLVLDYGPGAAGSIRRSSSDGAAPS